MWVNELVECEAFLSFIVKCVSEQLKGKIQKWKK